MAAFLLAGICGYIFAQVLMQYQPWLSIVRYFSNAHVFVGIATALLAVAVLGIGRKFEHTMRAKSKFGAESDSRGKSSRTWRYILAVGVVITLILIRGAHSRNGRDVEDPMLWMTCCLGLGLCFTAAALVAHLVAPDNVTDPTRGGQ